VRHNRVELELRCVPPVLTTLRHRAAYFDTVVDWLSLARQASAVPPKHQKSVPQHKI